MEKEYVSITLFCISCLIAKQMHTIMVVYAVSENNAGGNSSGEDSQN